jgi:uncharacterized membrane protein
MTDQFIEENQLYVALGYCAFMFLLAMVLKQYPPKNINHLYGYRTKRSMKNQIVWDAANKFSANVFLRICLYSFLIPAAGYFVFPELNVLITIVINTLLLFYVHYATENYLKTRFDLGGNPFC